MSLPKAPLPELVLKGLEQSGLLRSLLSGFLWSFLLWGFLNGFEQLKCLEQQLKGFFGGFLKGLT